MKKVKISSGIMVLLLLTSCGLFQSKPLKNATGNTKDLKKDEILVYDKMYEGIKINGIDIKDLSKAEALEKVKAEIKIPDEIVIFTLKDFKKSLTISDIDFEYDFETAVNEAFNLGRTGSEDDRIAFLQNILTNNKNIEVKSKYNKEKMAEVITALEKELNKEVKDGRISYENGKADVVEGVDGVKIKTEELKSLVENFVAGNTVEIPSEIVEAKKVDKKLAESINGVIGEAYTEYPAGNWNRGTNIVLASGKLHEVIIMPGETFSFVKYVNNITAGNGYKLASTFIGNKEVDGIGGGICQVSSTLYMAALKADMQIVERNQHSLRVGYCPLGLDAMYYEGSSDLKFKNNFDFPVVITTTAGGGGLSFKILGDTNKKNYSVKIWNGGVTTIPMPIEYIEDDTLEEGVEKVVEAGHNGYKGSSYIQRGNNDAVLLNSDYYHPKKQIVRIGTKKRAPKPDEKDPNDRVDEENNENNG